ncbi:MAG: HYR domain-containing protein, partial [Saprospirales bacterium]
MKYTFTLLFSLIVTFFTFVQVNNVSAQYCIPQYISGCASDHMNDVEFPDAGIIHLGTGASPNCYGDFTNDPSLLGTMEIGETYSFSISHGFGSQWVRIYIDFNNNQSFEDAGELLFSSTVGSNLTSGSITIPANVDPGTVRMRLISSWLTIPPNSCEGGTNWGETHDYTVELIQAGPGEDDDCDPDVTPPVVVCPSDIIITLNPGECNRIVNYNVTATDNCPFVADADPLRQDVPFTNFWTGWAINLDNETTDQDILVTSVEVQASLAGAPAGNYNIRVFMRDGEFQGNLNSPDGWVEVGNEDVFIGAGFPTVSLYEIPFSDPFAIPAGGTSGMAVYANNGNGFAVRMVGELGTGPTTDGVLTINNNPGRWLVPFGTNGFWTGEAFPGENPRPQLQVSYQTGGDATIIQTTGLPSGSTFEVGTVTNCFEVEDLAGNIGECCFDVTVNEFPNPSPV